jgi:hypothetical protein
MTEQDFYIRSNALKVTIVERCKEFKIPMRYLCREAKIDYRHFMMAYINSRYGNECKITPEQFRRVLAVLGIEERRQFVVLSNYNGDEKALELKNKYEQETLEEIGYESSEQEEGNTTIIRQTNSGVDELDW